ncbi:MAG: hypothetical protein OEV30_09525 [Ignavibacteria bacterium]|nr:hypothetical protein [Ignavibacteria bacterium]
MLNLVEFILFEAVSQIVRPLSYRAVGRLGRWYGSLGYYCLRIRRARTLTNLRFAFPQKTEEERKAIAAGAYRNFGIAIMQLLWSRYATADQLKQVVRIPDRRILNECLDAGKGIVLLSAHFGCWEFIAQGLRLQIGHPINSIVQRQRNQYIDRIIDRTRRRHGNSTISKGVQSRASLTVLKSGGILGLLGDQSGPKESIFVDFFGRAAATHRGPAAFSLKTGSPILFVVLVRQSDGTYDAIMDRVQDQDLKGYSEEAIVELTRRHVSLLEKRIREHPDQWLWMHNRWKHTMHAPNESATA